MSLINLAVLAYDTLCELSQMGCSDHPEDNQPTIIEAPKPLPVAVAAKLDVLTTSTRGLIELANYEALSNQIYLDSVNVRTIGIGMTVSEMTNINKLPWNYTITDKQAVDQYVQALKKYENAVKKVLKVKVTQNEFDALVSITYNIGTGNTKTMQGGMAGSTFMRRLNNKESPARVVEAMQWWNKGGGRVIRGLTIRRKAEGAIFLKGNYLNNGTVQRIKVNPTTHKPIYDGRVNIAQYL